MLKKILAVGKMEIDKKIKTLDGYIAILRERIREANSSEADQKELNAVYHLRDDLENELRKSRVNKNVEVRKTTETNRPEDLIQRAYIEYIKARDEAWSNRLRSETYSDAELRLRYERIASRSEIEEERAHSRYLILLAKYKS